jgi:hypothetical protein
MIGFYWKRFVCPKKLLRKRSKSTSKKSKEEEKEKKRKETYKMTGTVK